MYHWSRQLIYFIRSVFLRLSINFFSFFIVDVKSGRLWASRHKKEVFKIALCRCVGSILSSSSFMENAELVEVFLRGKFVLHIFFCLDYFQQLFYTTQIGRFIFFFALLHSVYLLILNLETKEGSWLLGVILSKFCPFSIFRLRLQIFLRLSAKILEFLKPLYLRSVFSKV